MVKKQRFSMEKSCFFCVFEIEAHCGGEAVVSKDGGHARIAIAMVTRRAFLAARSLLDAAHEKHSTRSRTKITMFTDLRRIAKKENACCGRFSGVATIVDRVELQQAKNSQGSYKNRPVFACVWLSYDQAGDEEGGEGVYHALLELWLIAVKTITMIGFGDLDCAQGAGAVDHGANGRQ